MRTARPISRDIREGLQELEEKKKPEAQSIVDSTRNLAQGLRDFGELLAQGKDEFVGIIHGGWICSEAELNRNRIVDEILSAEAQPSAVFGKELRILSTDDGNGYNETVYLGSQPVAASDEYNGQHEYQIFFRPVNRDDYETFQRRIKEIAGADLGSNPTRPLPRELVAEVQAVRQEILEGSLAACSSMLDQATGKLIGTERYTRFQGGYHSTSLHFTENIHGTGQKDKIFENVTRGATPIFDTSLTHSLNSSGVGYHEGYYLGGKEIANHNHNYERGGHSYQIMGHSVTEAGYKQFVDQVKALLEQRGIDQKSELPAELKTELSRFQMNRTLSNATAVQEGWIQLRDIYGGSYFGSGGGYGSVRAYDLDDWRKGIRTELPLETKAGDNGFVSGPNAVDIKPGMIVIARGGDSIGEGRSWTETYRCERQS